ncbi:uncharacterized protein [Dermacentor albipictus]|uniref:uncharacterized protein n=1 Tax=Dermacentor albipictus TaxID=60249 RepID=UPI0031FDC297
MYPPDGLCHYLFYWNVVVRNGTMRGVDVSLSWKIFKHETARLKKTSGGISFDARYVTPASVRSVEEELKDIAKKNNIVHYGVLNMLAAPEKAHDMLQQTKAALRELKNMQGNDLTQKTILAMGLYDYGRRGEHYANFANLFKEAIESSHADTVIAISSVGWMYNPRLCECTPPSVWDTATLPGKSVSWGKRYPDLKRSAALMSKDHRYNNSKVQVGLSFELATLVYNRSQAYTYRRAVNIALLHSYCNQFFATSFDVVPCKIGSTSSRIRVHPDINMAFRRYVPSLIFLFEDEDTLAKKCKDLTRPSTNLRPNMAILLLNVHLVDYNATSECGNTDPARVDPFWRIRVVKTTLNIT